MLCLPPQPTRVRSFLLGSGCISDDSVVVLSLLASRPVEVTPATTGLVEVVHRLGHYLLAPALGIPVRLFQFPAERVDYSQRCGKSPLARCVVVQLVSDTGQEFQ